MSGEKVREKGTSVVIVTVVPYCRRSDPHRSIQRQPICALQLVQIGSPRSLQIEPSICLRVHDITRGMTWVSGEGQVSGWDIWRRGISSLTTEGRPSQVQEPTVIVWYRQVLYPRCDIDREFVQVA